MKLIHKQIFSYIITFFVYNLFFSWYLAIILMFSIAWHESGHLWAAKRMGYESKGFFLFPFVGGLAISDGKTERYSQQAFVVLMGPIAGGLLALVTYLAYLGTHISFIGEAAQWMAWINLFNLAPLGFLDGGQILESIVHSINETAGMIVMAISTFISVPVLWLLSPPIAIFIGILGGLKVWNDIRQWKTRKSMKIRTPQGRRVFSDNEIDLVIHRPKPMSINKVLITFACYTLTAGCLLFLIHLTNNKIHMNDLFVK